MLCIQWILTSLALSCDQFVDGNLVDNKCKYLVLKSIIN